MNFGSTCSLNADNAKYGLGRKVNVDVIVVDISTGTCTMGHGVV